MSIIEKLNLLQDKSNTDSTEYILALSGGLDSVVLLDFLTKLPKLKFCAVYINHKLQPDADLWVETNADICKKYNVAYSFYNLNFTKKVGESLEAQARVERYKVFADLIDTPNKVLLTAHHMNDQAETFLLQLMRGAGPKGLSAMPAVKTFSKGRHLRPMLAITRAELLKYAMENKLSWVEDKTNSELTFDRNYIRNIILPALEQRWPSAVLSIAKSAKHNASHELLLNNYIKNDYNHCRINQQPENILDINQLILLENNQLRAVLRYWFSRLNFLMPSQNKLNQIINTCILNNNSSSTPEVVIADQVVTRYKNKLYILDYKYYQNTCTKTFDYHLGQDLSIPDLKIKISSKLVNQNSLDHDCYVFTNNNNNNILTIKFRTKGERCRPVGRGGSVSVKKLLQECNIPPWQRNKIPLFYVGDEIAAVLIGEASVKVCEPFFSRSCQAGWVVTIEHDC